MGERVRVTDVSPRDGLQNEPGVIPTAEKVRLVELLSETGIHEIEVSSFVSAKWIPQLGDAAEVFQSLARGANPLLSALVPNQQGFEAAMRVNQSAGRKLVGKVSVFTAASETFTRKNTNATIAETIERFKPVVAGAHREGLLVRGYVSCIIACPFEGPIAPAAVIHVAEQLRDLGVDELDLGDTTGAGTTETISSLIREYTKSIPIRTAATHPASPTTTLHLHDTFGRAADCVKAALQLGVRSFDGSVAGLGGCPYASTPGKRAPGNISTETLIRTLHASGYETGVNLEKLGQAADFARTIVGKSRRP